jgi:hypothetical protein
VSRELLTPQQMRVRLIESYLLTYAAQGRRVDVADVERDVIAELELVDAARRAGELDGGSHATKDTTPSAVRPDLLAEAQAETHTKLTVDRDPADGENPHRYRPRVLHRNPMQTSARWGAAVARIGRIIEGASGSTLAAAAANAKIPELAKRWVEVYGYYMTRAMPPPATRVDHNPFRGLSDRDAARAFMRAVEDICDASTGVLGAWYCRPDARRP